jgi:hypothetical protein
MSEDSCLLTTAMRLLTATQMQIEIKLLDEWRCRQTETKRRRYSKGLSEKKWHGMSTCWVMYDNVTRMSAASLALRVILRRVATSSSPHSNVWRPPAPTPVTT